MTANGLFSHTSTCFGTDHSPDVWQLVKCHRLRKQWALARHTGQEMSFAAYFTNEDDARAFARSMGLTLCEHDEPLRRGYAAGSPTTRSR